MDTDIAITCLKQALDLTPAEHPNRSMCLNFTGVAMIDRYRRLGELRDLEEAIDYLHEAVGMIPVENPNKPEILNELGSVMIDRFKHFGDLEDLTKAIDFMKQAVDLTPDDHFNRSMHINNLGIALRNRYQHLGELVDLEDAIVNIQRAVDLTSTENPNRPIYLNNLGNALDTRYLMLGQLKDLEEAIICGKQAVDLTPHKHPNRSIFFNNLGNRYYENNEIDNARKAFIAMSTVIESIRASSTMKVDSEKMVSDYASSYARLVTCCLMEGDAEAAFRYAEAGKSRSLVDALQAEHQWLTDTPVEDPDLAEKLGKAERLRADIEYLLDQPNQSGKDEDDGERVFLGSPSEIQNELSKKLQKEDALWQTIESDHPAFALTTSAPPYTVEQAQTLAARENATLISFYQHDHGWIAFVVSNKNFTPIPLEGVNTMIKTALGLLPSIAKGLFRKGPAVFCLLQQLYIVLFKPIMDYLPAQGQP